MKGESKLTTPKSPILAKLSNKVVGILKKSFGDDSTFMISDPKFSSAMPYGIPSGSLMLDSIMGRPGYPIGRFIEIVGLESSGKSTIAQHVLMETQKMGGVAIYAEVESGLDVSRARVIGLDEETLIPLNPKDLEKFFEMSVKAIEAIRKGGLPLSKPIVVVLDSVAGFVSEAEAEHDFGDSSMGVHARVISQSLRKLMYFLPRMGATYIFLNQLRSTFVQYGETLISFGGKALKYRSSIRLNVTSLGKSKMIKGLDGTPVAQPVRVVVIKNKLNVPFKETELIINFQKGFVKWDDAIKAGVIAGILRQRKAMFQIAADGKNGKKFRKKQFARICKERFGGYAKFRQLFYKTLQDSGRMKPYGDDDEMKQWERKMKKDGLLDN